ncbi:Ig-like domain-containing protein [Lysinibacillus sp. NPDC058147]|uniref:Ig-like domain-containing protein n=1 Tax=unclassified Lysinibacillus TaxID=2636778 RepID=UPI0036DD2CF0
MVNFFKKSLIYLALMLLVLVSFNVESASAAEVIDYEEGVTNLNNTPENSAIIGSRLLQPEIGWKRYDDSNLNIQYLGTAWTVRENHPSFYARTDHFAGIGAIVKFNFTGTKLRINSVNSAQMSDNIEIYIDGVKETYSSYSATAVYQIVNYEKTGLKDRKHYVEIRNLGKGLLGIDSIDVDGKLLAENEVPNVESITLDRNTLELLEGSQDKLTATVTPDAAKVIWSSSDESIATVDQDGNIIAIREGQAIITATIENTDISATSTVIVKKPNNEFSNAILSITLVNGITKEYDVTNTVLTNYLNWFDNAQGTSTFKFSKTISPYKKVTEYIVHDKIASFEVREY